MVKIAHFSRFHCVEILRRDLSTKKIKQKKGICPEGLGVMLELSKVGSDHLPEIPKQKHYKN